MNCATFAQLSSTHEICKAAGTYPQTAADHRADSVNLITTSTHHADVSIEQGKMNNKLNNREREHLAKVKSLPCSVCDAPAPSEAHHIKQGQQYTAVALCPDCHRGGFNGWHGQKMMWRVMKMDELDALNVTFGRLNSE